MRFASLRDHEAAVVAVESRLDSVRRTERRSHDLELERQTEVRTAAQDVVAHAGLVCRGAAGRGRPEREPAGRRRVLVGDALGAVVADADVVAVALPGEVD